MTKKTLKRRRAMMDEDDNEGGGEEESGKQKRGYSEGDDKCIKKIGSIEGESDRAGDILVRIMSYKGGPKKVAVNRHGTKKDGSEWFSPKLGRMTLKESKRLRVLLRKANAFLEKEEGGEDDE